MKLCVGFITRSIENIAPVEHWKTLLSYVFILLLNHVTHIKTPIDKKVKKKVGSGVLVNIELNVSSYILKILKNKIKSLTREFF